MSIAALGKWQFDILVSSCWSLSGVTNSTAKECGGSGLARMMSVAGRVELNFVLGERGAMASTARVCPLATASEKEVNTFRVDEACGI